MADSNGGYIATVAGLAGVLATATYSLISARLTANTTLKGQTLLAEETEKGRLQARITTLEADMRAQRKEYEVRIDTLEKEVDALRDESRTLKDTIYQLHHPLP